MNSVTETLFGFKYSDGVIKHSCMRYVMMDNNFFLRWRAALECAARVSHLLACIKIHEENKYQMKLILVIKNHYKF